MLKRMLVILGSLVFGIHTLLWAGGPGTTNADFLKAEQGVRAIGMGESYVALGQGLDTLYWNPAGLVQLDSPTATFTHSFWLQDIGTEYLAYGTPLGPLGAFGGGVTYLHAGTIDQTTEDQYGNYNGINGQASASSMALIGTYSQKLSHLLISQDALKDVLVGVSLRVVNENIADKDIFGAGLDLGAIWRQTEEIKPQDVTSASGQMKESDDKYAVRDRGWRLGLVAQNLGVTSENLLPINFRAGTGYVFQEVFSKNGRATLAADVLVPIDNSPQVSFGAEYAHVSENTEFAARVGYKVGPELTDLDSSAGFTAGLGAAIQASLIRYQIDYAFVPYGELGTTHRVSLTVAFLPNENPVRAAEVSSKVVAPLKTEPLSAAASSATAAPAVEAQPDASKQFRQAVERLNNRIKSGLLSGIEFKKGETKYSDRSQATLDRVGALMQQYKTGRVVIIGFDADPKIAADRAKSVAKYLSMTSGVTDERMVIKAGDPVNQPKNSAIAFGAAE